MTATKTRQHVEHPENVTPVESDFSATVAHEVLERLGTPSDLLKVKATNVFDNAYRVNVYRSIGGTGELIKASSITDSFFVLASDRGELVNANISKKYGETHEN